MLPNGLTLTPPIAGMNLTISPKDTMFVREHGEEVALGNYLQSGRTALQVIHAALAAAGKTDVRRILDLPCGFGRVLRVLKAAFPDAHLTACDLERDGVDFCASEFGAKPIYSVEDPARISLDGPYDLIWCGSLLTHFDAPRWLPLLETFRTVLTDDGLCVFTTHGVGAVEYLTHGRSTYGIMSPDKLLRQYRKSGFAFLPYQPRGTYGVSLSSPAWVAGQVAALPKTRLVLLTEKGWDNHQDAVAIGPIPDPLWIQRGW